MSASERKPRDIDELCEVEPVSGRNVGGLSCFDGVGPRTTAAATRRRRRTPPKQGRRRAYIRRAKVGALKAERDEPRRSSTSTRIPKRRRHGLVKLKGRLFQAPGASQDLHYRRCTGAGVLLALPNVV